MNVLRSVEFLLRPLVEHADRPLARMLLAAFGALPVVAPFVRYRTGAIDAARRALQPRWRPAMPWERRFARKIDAMLAPIPASPPPVAACGAAQPVRRVLYVVDVDASMSRSGYTLRTSAMVDALRARGMHVTVHARLADPGNAAALFESEAAAIERHAAALCRIVERDGIDLIHAASPYANAIAAQRAARQCGIAAVYEMRGLWHHTRALHEPLYGGSAHHAYCESQERAACRGASRVIALSGPMAQWMQAHGVAGDRIDVIGNAAAGMYIAEQRDRRDVSVLGYAGALVAYEGLDALLHTLASGAMPGIRLEIAGHGRQRRPLDRLARRLRIADRIRFLGRLEAAALDTFYARVDAIVLPRTDTPLVRMVPSLKPYDALARGVPVLLSAAAAAALEPSLIARDDVVVFDRPTALPDAIRRLMQRSRSEQGPVPVSAERAALLIETYERAIRYG